MATGTERCVVLLAEDDVLVRNLVRHTLERAGFRVLAAADGLEALTFSRQYPEHIDVLLTDVDMPHLDGVTLAEYVKSERPEILVLVMSGREPRPIRIHNVKVELLSKPFLPQVLVMTIRKLIETA
jgi:two-component system cell cycle sensor histidine kinase/response regulator CckA